MVRGRALLDLGLGRDLGAGVARVLVLGDGDFAYSSTLVSALAGLRTDLLATVYDSESDLLARCPEAAARIDTIRATGARVACSIDARALDTQLPGEPPWHRVVFNLPQAPPLPKARNQIQRHRALLREVCASVEPLLAVDGELWLTLLSGQGGTPLDPLSSRKWGDTWQLQHEAARAGLIVHSVEPADIDALDAAGYVPGGRGHRATRLGPKRQSRGLVVHRLCREGEGPRRAVGPLQWAFDNSFWQARDIRPPR